MLLVDARAVATWRNSLPRTATVGLVPKQGATSAIAASKKNCDYTVIAVDAPDDDRDGDKVIQLQKKKASDELKQVWIEGAADGSAEATEAMYLLSWTRPDTVFVDVSRLRRCMERYRKIFCSPVR